MYSFSSYDNVYDCKLILTQKRKSSFIYWYLAVSYSRLFIKDFPPRVILETMPKSIDLKWEFIYELSILFYIYILSSMLVPHSTAHCNFVTGFQTRMCESSNFISQECSGFSRSSEFSYFLFFEISFSTSMKYALELWKGLYWLCR